jgi:hypothetical protein
MKLWSALKRLNQRYDAWALAAANRAVAALDRSSESGAKPEARRSVNVWDLLSSDRAKRP